MYKRRTGRQRPLLIPPSPRPQHPIAFLCPGWAPGIGRERGRRGSRAHRRARSPVHHVRPQGLTAELRARRGRGGRGSGAAAPALWAFSGSSCRRRRRCRRAAAATAAFPCGIWNPCASLTMKQSSNVPAFLSKLWTLVEETHTNEFITWSQVRVRVRRPPNPLTNRLLSHSLPQGCLSRPVARRPVRGPWVGGVRRASAFGLAGDPLYCSRGEPRGSQPATLVQAAVGEGRLRGALRPGRRRNGPAHSAFGTGPAERGRPTSGGRGGHVTAHSFSVLSCDSRVTDR